MNAFRLPRNIDPQRGAMDGQLLARIAAAADVCRRARQPLSLMLCELDRHDEMLAFGGIQRVQRLVDFIEQSILECVQTGSGGISLGDARFAVVLENCDRAEALQFAREVADRIQSESPPCALPGGCGVSLSVGVASLAVPPRNFAPEDLLTASHRCLYAATTLGGGMIKSIDLM